MYKKQRYGVVVSAISQTSDKKILTLEEVQKGVSEFSVRKSARFYRLLSALDQCHTCEDARIITRAHNCFYRMCASCAEQWFAAHDDCPKCRKPLDWRSMSPESGDRIYIINLIYIDVKGMFSTPRPSASSGSTATSLSALLPSPDDFIRIRQKRSSEENEIFDSLIQKIVKVITEHKETLADGDPIYVHLEDVESTDRYSLLDKVERTFKELGVYNIKRVTNHSSRRDYFTIRLNKEIIEAGKSNRKF